MKTPTWKLIKDEKTGLCEIVWRRWPNGMEESTKVDSEMYLKWLSEGNQPLPADEGTPSA